MTETREQQIARLRAEAAALQQHADALRQETNDLFGNVASLDDRRAERHDEVAPDVEVLIESNNACVRETCPLCGAAHKDADMPHWFFMANKRGLCADCASDFYPEEFGLVLALNKFWRKPKEPDYRAVNHLLQSVNANMRTPAAVRQEQAERIRAAQREFFGDDVTF